MADFATARLSREQLVLFPQRLDKAIAPDHAIRLLDDILGRIDWTTREQTYDLTRGQPPIHPRVLAGAILYGLLKRIRTSRALEEALEVRNDFRWLVEDRRIDHTTICKFRQKNSANLKNLFVRIALLARELGHLPLASLGFDGTRLRANNRKTGTRTPEELRKAKEELAAKYTELEAQAAAADAQVDQRLGKDSEHKLGKELADVALRQKRVDAALAELERLEQAGQKKPARIPITDPQSRVTPNKEGGFAPNYTPTATVDNVQATMGLEQPPVELLADGMMSTGENLAACKEQGIDFYSPIKGTAGADNPAVREDPSVPVPAEDIERLPTTTTKKQDGTTSTTFNKSAFVYDVEADVYWCPAGKPLPYT